MRFLFTTLQYVESDFYGRVGQELERRGHEAFHLTWSRRAAALLGGRSRVLPEAMDALGTVDVEREAARQVERYGLPTLRDVWRTDWPCDGRPDDWCAERTVRHFMALEQLLHELRPDVLVPEVGNETIRIAAQQVALDREIPVQFLLYTIFPNPLRIEIDDVRARLVDHGEPRELRPDEQAEVDAFSAEFRARELAIRPHRESPLRLRRARLLARHLAVKALWDRDNDYLRPDRWLVAQTTEQLRRPLSRRLYDPVGERPYVYFPLQVVDDYKLARLTPHLVDQASLAAQLASALPPDYELVVKEHPMSIGRNRLSLLRQLRRVPGLRLRDPHTSSHELIRGADAVAVISSTVGLEALLYMKPVMTLGRPFYSGGGVTLDVEALGDLREAVPALLRYRPDPERVSRLLHSAMRSGRPGAPVLVDRSDANARLLAGSIEEAAAGEAERRRSGVPGMHEGAGLG